MFAAEEIALDHPRVHELQVDTPESDEAIQALQDDPWSNKHVVYFNSPPDSSCVRRT